MTHHPFSKGSHFKFTLDDVSGTVDALVEDATDCFVLLSYVHHHKDNESGKHYFDGAETGTVKTWVNVSKIQIAVLRH